MRLLWLKTELLHPVDKGGKIRTYQMLRALKREHHVTYLTLDDGGADPEAAHLAFEYCQELVKITHDRAPRFSARFYGEVAANLFSTQPYAVQRYRSAGMQEEVVRRLKSRPYDLVVCDFLAPAVNLPPVMARPTVLFEHNVEAIIWKRHYEIAENPIKKSYVHRQWKRMERFERAVCRRVDGVITVSADDTRSIRQDYGVSDVEDVPTGVDTDYFHPSGATTRDPRNIVFTGSMDWMPNDDAIRFFCDKVWPPLRAVLPDVTLTVVGRSPLPWLKELASREPALTVTGRVDDVRPYLERASAFVVPIRVGGGTRLKIYEAMGMECPMVSTTIGAEGLPLVPERDILLADTPEALSRAVVRLLTDVAFARGMAERAARRVREEFGWDRVAARFATICERIAAKSPNVGAGL